MLELTRVADVSGKYMIKNNIEVDGGIEDDKKRKMKSEFVQVWRNI